MRKSLFLLLFIFISATAYAGNSDIPDKIEDYSKHAETIEKIYKAYPNVEEVEILSCYKYKLTMSAINDITNEPDNFLESMNYDSWIIPDYIEEPFTLLFVVRLTAKNDDGSYMIFKTFTILEFTHFREYIWY